MESKHSKVKKNKLMNQIHQDEKAKSYSRKRDLSSGSDDEIEQELKRLSEQTRQRLEDSESSPMESTSAPLAAARQYAVLPANLSGKI